MSAFRAFLGHRFADVAPTLMANCTPLALGSATATPPPPPSSLKYLPAAIVRWWRDRKAAKTKTTPLEGEAASVASGAMSSLEFVNYTVAAGISFAVFENLGVLYSSVSGGNSAAELLLLLAERTISALPGKGGVAWCIPSRMLMSPSTPTTSWPCNGEASGLALLVFYGMPGNVTLIYASRL